jgi:heme oxygenase
VDEEEALKQIQYYIEIGAIRLAGYNDEGEAIFELNENVTKDLAPELWEAHMEYVDDNLTELFEEGLMNVEYDENLEATMHFTKEGYEIALEKGIIPLEDQH